MSRVRRALAIVTFVALAGCTSGPAHPASPPSPTGPALVDSGDTGTVVEHTLPSVVSVQVREGEHSGTGFRVGIDGIVVTSAQAVAGAGDGAPISVVLADGSRRAATVLGRAPDVDVAAIRLDGAQIPAMHSRSGFEQARAGDRVLAMQAPPAGERPAISATLLAKDRRVAVGGGAEQAVIALDAGVDPGTSGAPVVNAAGDVLGMITLTAPAGSGRPGDRSFAVSVDVARRAVFAIVDRV